MGENMDEKLMNLPLEKKVEKAEEVIKEAYEKFEPEEMAIAFTGGKDSTLLLWLVKRVCDKNNYEMPNVMFINEGDVFEEIWDFVFDLSEKWGFELKIAENVDVLRLVKKIGDPVKVRELNEFNRQELKKIGFQGDEFPFEPESFVGNHLMKTVAMKMFIIDNGIKALFTGIRWDEQEARRNETYFSPRDDPEHTRIHPILHFTEKDVWDATFKYKIPFNKLYAEGYRSLGAKSTTKKIDDRPAWEQDLEKVPERAGRRQDKEGIMKRLRDLGYM